MDYINKYQLFHGVLTKMTTDTKKLPIKKIFIGLGVFAALLALGIGLFLFGGQGDAKTRWQALTGNAEAQMKIARAYFIAEGDARDEKSGARWTERAAKNGYAPAVGLTGILYMGGIGVPQDFVKAEQWLAQSNDEQARDMGRRLETVNAAVAKLPTEMRMEKIKENHKTAEDQITESFYGIIGQMKTADEQESATKAGAQ
jgi:hypothetical protein